MRGGTPPGAGFLTAQKEPREIPQKNTAGSHTYEGGIKMAEDTKKSTEKKSKRPKMLTEARIKKEKGKLSLMFEAIEDKDKKSLVNSLIEEAAFLKIALLQAKAELKKEGLTAETINASQKFIKAHPATEIYNKYSKQYTQIIGQLIDYLPPKEQKKVSRLASLRDE